MVETQKNYTSGQPQ